MSRSQADILLLILAAMLVVMMTVSGYAIFHFEYAKYQIREMQQRVERDVR